MDPFEQLLQTARRIDLAGASPAVDLADPFLLITFESTCQAIAERNHGFYTLLADEIRYSFQSGKLPKEVFPDINDAETMDSRGLAQALSGKNVESIIQDIVNFACNVNKEASPLRVASAIRLLTDVNNALNCFFTPSAQRLEDGRHFDMALSGGSPREFVTVNASGSNDFLVRTADGLRDLVKIALPRQFCDVKGIFRCASSSTDQPKFVVETTKPLWDPVPEARKKVSGYAENEKLSFVCVGEQAFPVDKNSLAQIGDLVSFRQKSSPLLTNGTRVDKLAFLGNPSLHEFGGKAYLIDEFSANSGCGPFLDFSRINSNTMKLEVVVRGVGGKLNEYLLSGTRFIKICDNDQYSYVCLESGRCIPKSDVVELDGGYLAVKKNDPTEGWDCYDPYESRHIGTLPSGVDPRTSSFSLVSAPCANSYLFFNHEDGQLLNLATGGLVCQISANPQEPLEVYFSELSGQYIRVTQPEGQAGCTHATVDGVELARGMHFDVGINRYITERDDGAILIWNSKQARSTAPFGKGAPKGSLRPLQCSDCTKYAIFEMRKTKDGKMYLVVDVSGQQARVCFATTEKPAFYGGSLRLPLRSCVMNIPLEELEAGRDKPASMADAG
jgi:hypothetical protein